MNFSERLKTLFTNWLAPWVNPDAAAGARLCGRARRRHGAGERVGRAFAGVGRALGRVAAAAGRRRRVTRRRFPAAIGSRTAAGSHDEDAPEYDAKRRSMYFALSAVKKW